MEAHSSLLAKRKPCWKEHRRRELVQVYSFNKRGGLNHIIVTLFPTKWISRFFFFLFPCILSAFKWSWLFNDFCGFSGICFRGFFLCHFYLTVLNHQNTVKHFSGSLIDTLLPTCLLFRFFFVKMTQGFLFCCFPKTNGAASLPLHLCLHQDDSTHLKFQGSLALGREWGAGSRHWEGWGWGAQWPVSSPRSWSSFPSTHAWRYLRDPLTTSADLSCLYPELLMPRSWWKPLPLAIEIPHVALFIHPETIALTQPASPVPQNCAPLTPRVGMGPTDAQHMDLSQHPTFPTSPWASLSPTGVGLRYGYIFMSSSLPFP